MLKVLLLISEVGGGGGNYRVVAVVDLYHTIYYVCVYPHISRVGAKGAKGAKGGKGGKGGGGLGWGLIMATN